MANRNEKIIKLPLSCNAHYSLEDELPYNAMAAQLADIIDCNACIIDGSGNLLGYSLKYKTNNNRTGYFRETYFSGRNM